MQTNPHNIFGLWKLEEKREAIGSTELYFMFEDGKVTLVSQLERKGFLNKAKHSVPARYTDDSIQVLENSTVTKKLDFPNETFTLKLTLNQAMMRFKMKGDQLVIESDTLGIRELTRAFA